MNQNNQVTMSQWKFKGKKTESIILSFSGRRKGAGTRSVSRRIAADPQNAADVLAEVRPVLAAVDSVGAGAVPTETAVVLALQRNLIGQPSALHFPQQRATRPFRFGTEISEAEAILAAVALARRTGECDANHGGYQESSEEVERMCHHQLLKLIPQPTLFSMLPSGKRLSQVGRSSRLKKK
jgi:hypothetical protein